eukprot:gene3507-4006_t
MFNHQPYCVVTGTVGVGKSTLVSNLTGCPGIASSGSSSATKTAMVYPTIHGFQVADTPGNNPLKDKMDHNMWVAESFNYRPVSLLMVCVEAHVRLDQTIDSLREPLERFCEFDSVLCPVITKMDQVTWSQTDLRNALNYEFGVDRVLYSSNNKPVAVLAREILALCQTIRPLDINVNNANFFRYFKVVDSNIKVLRTAKGIIETYENAVNITKERLKALNENQRMDLVFQFQHYMLDMIPTMQSKLANDCGFTMFGSQSAVEFGHIANLGNQLKNILYNIRIMALRFATDHGVSNCRKCPHCGMVWLKVAGCEGATTCGSRPGGVPESTVTSFATFSFTLSPFNITPTGQRPLQPSPTSTRSGVGCGKNVNWTEMQPVPVPAEISASQAAITTDDVPSLPERIQEDFAKFFEINTKTVTYNVTNVPK